MNLQPRSTPGASVTQTEQGWRLEIPAGLAGSYRLAQLDDYLTLPRSRFPFKTSATLNLRCRALTPSPEIGRGAIDGRWALPGTWGFGFWNDPFAVSLGLGGAARRLPALPNAGWFFHASDENYLSFAPDAKAQRTIPGNGFLAQTFSSPRIPAWALVTGLVAAPLLLIKPISKWLRMVAGKLIREDAKRLEVDVTQWHEYRLKWEPGRVEFAIDGENVFETAVSPRGPLGLVIWIDNQFMAWKPDSSLRMGTLANPRARLEIWQLEVSNE